MKLLKNLASLFIVIASPVFIALAIGVLIAAWEVIGWIVTAVVLAVAICLLLCLVKAVRGK